jgi:hypothetical protein
MSGGKGRGKQSRDTASEDALVARPGATGRLLAAGEGSTDAQIVFALLALRQGLPHLTDLASLQDSRDGKQPEGTGTTEKGKQPAAQMKRTRTTRQATQTQPSVLAADAFVAALGAVPAEDWCRTWAAGRTIVLRRTSKRVKEAVDKMRLPAVVRLSRGFCDDARNGTGEAKLEFVLRQLAAMTARCLITTLELPKCEIKGQEAGRLAEVLAQCPALAHLNLSQNRIEEKGQRGLQEFWRSAQRWLTSISGLLRRFLRLRKVVLEKHDKRRVQALVVGPGPVGPRRLPCPSFVV